MKAEHIFKQISEAVEANPHDYSYIMGLLYADGIGCDRDFRLATNYFEDAYAFGDKRAAYALAKLFADRLSHTNLKPWEKELCHTQHAKWLQLAIENIRSK